MNPVAEFENKVRDIWRSDVNNATRANQMRQIAEGIDHYLIRAKAHPQPEDPWKRTAIQRSLDYLDHLAKDARMLAETLQA